MFELRTMEILPVNPMLYLPGALAHFEDDRGTLRMEKVMENQINNIEKQGIRNGEEIAGLNLSVGKVEQQVSQLTEVVTDMNGLLGKTELSTARIDGHLLRIDEHFVRIDKQFERVDERFDKVDQRFDKMEQRFDKVESSLAVIESNYLTKGEFHQSMSGIYEAMNKQSQLILKQSQWMVILMLVLVGITFTAARFIH